MAQVLKTLQWSSSRKQQECTTYAALGLMACAAGLCQQKQETPACPTETARQQRGQMQSVDKQAACWAAQWQVYHECECLC